MKSGIAIEELSADVRPQDDLFRYVNGPWLDQYEIPDDRARDGQFIRLHEEAQENIRVLIAEASADSQGDPDPDSVDAVERDKIGDLYASFMDEATIEAHGAAPLTPLLDRIAAVGDTCALVWLLGELERDGVTGAIGLYVNNDDRQPDRYVVNIVQAGIGLPDEAYYREDAFAEIRDAYLAHIQAMLELAGCPTRRVLLRARSEERRVGKACGQQLRP